MKLSDNVLLVMLVLAIAISLVSTFVSLDKIDGFTGMAVEEIEPTAVVEIEENGTEVTCTTDGEKEICVTS